MAITKIASIEVGAGGAASIDFTSIPGTYTDLMVVLSLRDSFSAPNGWREFNIGFNGVLTNRSDRTLFGTGSSVGVSSGSSILSWDSPANTTANTFANIQLYLPNYASTTANKSISIDGVSENNATSALQYINAGLWSSTAAITAVNIVNISNTFVQYSSATLYGVTKGSSGGVTVS